MRDYLIRIEGRDPVRISDCLHCARCGDALYPGDDYYDFDGEVLCPCCIGIIMDGMRRCVGE